MAMCWPWAPPMNRCWGTTPQVPSICIDAMGITGSSRAPCTHPSCRAGPPSGHPLPSVATPSSWAVPAGMPMHRASTRAAPMCTTWVVSAPRIDPCSGHPHPHSAGALVGPLRCTMPGPVPCTWPSALRGKPAAMARPVPARCMSAASGPPLDRLLDSSIDSAAPNMTSGSVGRLPSRRMSWSSVCRVPTAVHSSLRRSAAVAGAWSQR